MLGKAMENNEDISGFDWENADWLDEEQKENCRKYVKTQQEIKDLEEQKKKLKEDSLKCQECQKIPSNGKYYEVGGEGNYCKTCAEKIVDDAKNSNSSYNSSNEPREYEIPKITSSESTTNNQNPCNKCGLTFSTYYTVGGKGHYCNNCANGLAKSKNLDNQDNNSSNGKREREKKKYVLEGKTKKEKIESAKKMIREGYNFEDIDTSDFTKQEKSEIKNYKEELERGSNQDEQIKPFYQKPWVIIGAVIILLVPLAIIVIRNAKTRKKR